jgi:hypothetical protein
MNIYELSRNFWDWSFENPDKIKPTHCALYFFVIEHCNRLGWKEKFGFPTTMAMEAIGIKSYNTFINTLKDLVDFGFIVLIEKSRNQYSANILALSNFNKASNEALDKALIKHCTKQSESTVQSIDSIDIPIYNYTNIQDTNMEGTFLKNEQPELFELQTEETFQKKVAPKTRFSKPTIQEIQEYCQERNNQVDANKFFDHYESNGWMIGGKSKMKDWKAAIRNWERNSFNNQNQNQNGQQQERFVGRQSIDTIRHNATIGYEAAERVRKQMLDNANQLCKENLPEQNH